MLKKRIIKNMFLALSLTPALSQAGVPPLTLTLMSPTPLPTEIMLNQTVYLNYLVALDSRVPNSLSMTTVSNLPSEVVAVMSNMSTDCGGHYPICTSGFQLNPGPTGACCLVLAIANTNTTTTHSVTIEPIIQTTPAAYKAKAAPINLTFSSQPSGPAMLLVYPSASAASPLPTSPTVITASQTSLSYISFTVKNIGLATATGLNASFPGTSGINLTSTCNQATIAPGNSCSFKASTSTLNLPAFLTVTATDGFGHTITAKAPSMTATRFESGGISGLVYSKNGTSVQLAYATNGVALPWGPWLSNPEHNNGQANTSTIVEAHVSLGGANTDINYAAGYCYNLGNPQGTWYLPAACQMGASGENVGCTPGLDNIQTNLYNMGFLQTMNATNTGYWTSTSVGPGHEPFVYYQTYQGSFSNMLWGDVTDTSTNNRYIICASTI